MEKWFELAGPNKLVIVTTQIFKTRLMINGQLPIGGQVTDHALLTQRLPRTWLRYQATGSLVPGGGHTKGNLVLKLQQF